VLLPIRVELGEYACYNAIGRISPNLGLQIGVVVCNEIERKVDILYFDDEDDNYPTLQKTVYIREIGQVTDPSGLCPLEVLGCRRDWLTPELHPNHHRYRHRHVT